MTNSESRQLYNRLYRQFTVREVYHTNHFYDDKYVNWTWLHMLVKTRKVDGVMYCGRGGEVHVELS